MLPDVAQGEILRRAALVGALVSSRGGTAMRKLYFKLKRKLGLVLARLQSDEKRYAAMQKASYSVDPKNEFEVKEAVVGHYDAHEQYPYERYLLRDVPDPNQATALDFGCGPGRMLLRMSKILGRVDGVDISKQLIGVARQWTASIETVGELYVNSGTSLEAIPSGQYDMVYSTIALQHISVLSIREALFKEFHRVLKPTGQLALQMIYTEKPPEEWAEHVPWGEDRFDAEGTNSRCDVLITKESLPDVERSFEKAGFRDFRFELAPLQHEHGWATKVIFLWAKRA
jgi:SAM-dependent methyltransferase